MTTIFVSYTKEDTDCAEHIRQSLEAKGYTIWREPTSLTMESILYPRTIENVILGSAVFVLVWSSSAAQSEWVERHILFAQQLEKSIVPVVIDGTDLPTTLIVSMTITIQTSCNDVATQLLPHLPPPDSADPLIVLSEKAAHEFIRVRKEAIDQAADMLKRGEHREAVLAILEYLAHNDLMMGVREKAQEVLDADAKKVTTPAFRPETQEQIEEKQRLKAAFADMEKQQPAFLDEAGKSIIERVATFLAILFGVTAFGSSFPPPYLKTNAWNKYLVIATLLCYLAALALGMLAIRPRSYAWHRYQASMMAETLKKIIAYKKRLVQWAGILFAIGTLILAFLIVSIVWNV